MSGLTIILLVALIGVFILIKLDDKGKWETVYEAQGHQTAEIQRRESYLKSKGLHCRLKNHTPSTIRMAGMRGAQSSTQSTLQLQVHKKEADQAFRFLSELNA
ncbi:hypothetical protein JNUCC1_01703 [Lentibacillus sp. JNUCC-1]|uniref:hypothetical protein n=1 Tax=Lentibacillus sp. JNUCC-1 TaxID=2654513 RepID=UPI0012E70CAD|nr:hypothetical protein [Lentibacillus sp. JNUCC-1]MUV37897.1 hypothetical protein [Lentibacillus sp. JNUCC-1]